MNMVEHRVGNSKKTNVGVRGIIHLFTPGWVQVGLHSTTTMGASDLRLLLLPLLVFQFLRLAQTQSGETR